MNKEHLMGVLLAPHVSEKTTRLGEDSRQVVFQVRTSARKPEIKKAVEMLFDVKVASVQVANMKGKRKGFGRRMGKRPDWKKAYVSLKPGYDIDFLGGE